MNEKQLIAGLGEISHKAATINEALAAMEKLLSERVGSAVLILKANTPVTTRQPSGFSIADFLESHDFPFRGVYSERVESGGKSVATLVACFGTWGAPNQILKAATTQVARLLGAHVTRTGSRPMQFTVESETL